MRGLTENVGNEFLVDQFAFVRVLPYSGTPCSSSQRDELLETVCGPGVHRTCQRVNFFKVYFSAKSWFFKNINLSLQFPLTDRRSTSTAPFTHLSKVPGK